MFVLITGLLGSCVKTKGKKQAGNNRVVPVEALIAVQGQLENRIILNATLLPEEEVVLYPEVQGRVASILFKEGNAVAKGSLLVKLVDDDLQAQLRKLKTNESLLRAEEERKSKLLALKGISKEEYDISLNQLQSVQADISLIQANIRKTEILAPFSGTIGMREVSPGAFVSSTTKIASLVQSQTLKLEFYLPENATELVKPGDKLQFTTGNTPTPFEAEVYALEPDIDPATRTRRVRARFHNPDNLIKPGSFARVEINNERKDPGIVLPTQALVPQLKGYSVMYLSDGKVKTKQVEVGVRTDSLVEVIKGVEPMDTILLTGLTQVKEGGKVKISRIVDPAKVKGGSR